MSISFKKITEYSNRNRSYNLIKHHTTQELRTGRLMCPDLGSNQSPSEPTTRECHTRTSA